MQGARKVGNGEELPPSIAQPHGHPDPTCGKKRKTPAKLALSGGLAA